MSPRRNWDSPTPSIASECAPPPEPKGGGHTRLQARGWGESQFRRLKKQLSTLPTLWCYAFVRPIMILLKSDFRTIYGG